MFFYSPSIASDSAQQAHLNQIEERHDAPAVSPRVALRVFMTELLIYYKRWCANIRSCDDPHICGVSARTQKPNQQNTARERERVAIPCLETPPAFGAGLAAAGPGAT